MYVPIWIGFGIDISKIVGKIDNNSREYLVFSNLKKNTSHFLFHGGFF